MIGMCLFGKVNMKLTVLYPARLLLQSSNAAVHGPGVFPARSLSLGLISQNADLGRELGLGASSNKGELYSAVMEVRVHYRVQVGDRQHERACISRHQSLSSSQTLYSALPGPDP